MSQELVTTIEQNGGDGYNLELALAGWLAAKVGRSNSDKTRVAYQDAISAFRAALQVAGYDLDSRPGIVGLAAQGWAGRKLSATATVGNQGDGDAVGVAPATYNQRLAILSSFYTYAARQGLLPDENPIGRVERRPVQGYATAHAQDYSEVKARLKAIDRSTLDGKRDYALLSVAIQTGRRLSELAALTRGDMRLQTDTGKVTLNFKRTKGGKTIADTLPTAPSRALLDWLAVFYGISAMATLANSAPLWVSLSHRNRGERLTVQTLADICERRLGTSKFHSIRHTFARAMEDSGAKVSDIQARLGHSSLATTGRYLAALHSDTNAHADQLAALFGLE